MPRDRQAPQNNLLIQALRQQIEPHATPGLSQEAISSGCPQLDKILPGGSFRRGQLVEWLETGPGSYVTLSCHGHYDYSLLESV